MSTIGLPEIIMILLILVVISVPILVLILIVKLISRSSATTPPPRHYRATQQELTALEDAKNRNLISEAEYQEKRKKLLENL